MVKSVWCLKRARRPPILPFRNSAVALVSRRIAHGSLCTLPTPHTKLYMCTALGGRGIDRGARSRYFCPRNSSLYPLHFQSLPAAERVQVLAARYSSHHHQRTVPCQRRQERFETLRSSKQHGARTTRQHCTPPGHRSSTSRMVSAFSISCHPSTVRIVLFGQQCQFWQGNSALIDTNRLLLTPTPRRAHHDLGSTLRS